MHKRPLLSVHLQIRIYSIVRRIPVRSLMLMNWTPSKYRPAMHNIFSFQIPSFNFCFIIFVLMYLNNLCYMKTKHTNKMKRCSLTEQDLCTWRTFINNHPLPWLFFSFIWNNTIEIVCSFGVVFMSLNN